MMISIAGLVERIAYLLTDSDFDFWKREFHEASIEEAASLIALHKPSASAKRAEVTLVKGAVQALPDEAYRLIEVTHIDGRVLKRKTREEMDRLDSCWYSAQPILGVEYYGYDDALPHEFWVYPNANEGSKASVVYSVLPEIKDGAVNLTAESRQHLIDYALYRAHQRQGSENDAFSYLTAFYNGLGVKRQWEQEAEAKAMQRGKTA